MSKKIRRISFLILILSSISGFLSNSQAALRENPPLSETEVYLDKGSRLYNEGQYEDAILQWLEVLKINPANRLAAENIAMAQNKIRQKEALKVQPLQGDSDAKSSGVDISLGMIYLLPTDSAELGVGTGFLVEAGFPIVPSFAIKTSFGKYEQEVKSLEMALASPVGNLTTSPILVGVEFRPQISTVFMPRVGGGYGRFLFSNTLNSEFVANYFSKGFVVSGDIEDTNGYYLDIGLDYLLNSKKNFSISLDGKYIHAEPTIESSRTYFPTGATYTDASPLDISGAMLGIALKYKF